MYYLFKKKGKDEYEHKLAQSWTYTQIDYILTTINNNWIQNFETYNKFDYYLNHCLMSITLVIEKLTNLYYNKNKPHYHHQFSYIGNQSERINGETKYQWEQNS